MAITLASLQHGQTVEAPRILLYGVPGIGKSTMASVAPNPVFIFTEKGKGRLSVSNFPLATTWADVEGALRALLREEHEFETVVIDTLDSLERLIHDKVCKDEGKNSIEEFGYGKGYTFALNQWRTFLNLLDELHTEKGMVVILIAHSVIKTFNSPDTENYDQYRLAIHEKAASMIKGWVDCVLFANYDVKIKPPAPGDLKKTGKAIKTRDVPRLMHTQERPAYWAKNRYNLPETLPLSWPAFEEAMGAGIDEQKQLIDQLKAGETAEERE